MAMRTIAALLLLVAAVNAGPRLSAAPVSHFKLLHGSSHHATHEDTTSIPSVKAPQPHQVHRHSQMNGITTAVQLGQSSTPTHFHKDEPVPQASGGHSQSYLWSTHTKPMGAHDARSRLARERGNLLLQTSHEATVTTPQPTRAE